MRRQHDPQEYFAIYKVNDQGQEEDIIVVQSFDKAREVCKTKNDGTSQYNIKPESSWGSDQYHKP